MADTLPLRLLAQETGDLPVVSAALQDAICRVGDITFEDRTRQLTTVFNRFRWEVGKPQRVRSALQIGGVLEVQARAIRRDAGDAILELLSIGFEPGEAPGGVIMLSFAGGGDLRVTVECLDAVLVDVSAPWPTPRTPHHDL